jgi:hypothetical protein
VTVRRRATASLLSFQKQVEKSDVDGKEAPPFTVFGMHVGLAGLKKR